LDKKLKERDKAAGLRKNKDLDKKLKERGWTMKK
jgi:hypothetical protein